MKINLKSLMAILIFIPVLVITAFSGYNTYNAYLEYQKAKNGKEFLKLNNDILSLIKALGQERGTSAMLMASNGSFKFKGNSILNVITQKRKNLDEKFSNLLKIARSIQNSEFQEVLNIQDLEDKYNNIKELRSLIDNKLLKKEDFNEKEFNKIFDKYTNISQELLDYQLKFLKFLPGSTQKYIILNSRFGKIIDQYGIIRGKTSFYTVANFVMDDSIYKEIYENKLSNPEMLSWQIDKTNLSNIFLSPKYKEARETLLDNIFDIEGVLQSYYNSLEDNPEFLGYPIDASETWKIFTNYINFLVDGTKVLNKDIKENIATIEQQELNKLIINIAILLIILLVLGVLTLLQRNMNNHIHELEKLIVSLSRTLDLSDTDIKDIKVETNEGLRKAIEIVNNAIKETEQARLTAEESVKAKSLFLANMSHEIRTPLNGILGFLDLLKTTELTGEQEDYVNTIAKSAQNLLQIVNNILDVSKIESNKVSLEAIEFKIVDEIENTLEIFATPTSQKEIEYVVDLDPTLPRKLKGDVLKIKETFTNLVNNAIKFTPEEGTITVTVKNNGINPDTNKIKLYTEVQDTGIGMTEEQRKKVFEAFSQADVSVSRKYGGTGLGLTIVKSYIEMMNGYIDVESELNQGTKFFFEIELDVLNKEPKYDKNDLKGKTLAILNTKKNTKRKEVLFKYLKYLGVETIPFDDVKELEQIKQSEKIDGVLALFSESTRTKLKELEDIKDKVIIVSSFAYKEEVEKISDTTIWDPLFVSKGLSALEQLTKQIDKKERKQATVRTKTGYNIKALIAEDNPINQKLLQTTLKSLGIESEIAKNGLEAYNKYSSHYDRYDVIFMDVQMPIMDGLEATEQILEEEKDNDYPHIAIVAVTANALKGDREQFLGVGMDDYISKPINKDQLIKVIENVISEQYGNKLRTVVKKEEEEEEEIIDYGTDTKEISNNLEKEVFHITKQEEEINKILKQFKPKLLKNSKEVKEVLNNTKEQIFIIEEKLMPETHIKKLINIIKNGNNHSKIIIIGNKLLDDVDQVIENIKEISL